MAFSDVPCSWSCDCQVVRKVHLNNHIEEALGGASGIADLSIKGKYSCPGEKHNSNADVRVCLHSTKPAGTPGLLRSKKCRNRDDNCKRRGPHRRNRGRACQFEQVPEGRKHEQTPKISPKGP